MYTDDFVFQKDLLVHKVYTSWQFIEFTRKNIETVQYCYDTIISIIEKLTIKTIRWEQNLFSDFIEDVTVDGKQGRKVAVTKDNIPSYELRVAGEKVNPWFLFDKLLRDFFQYCMNSLDSISQIANAGLLANNKKKVDAVDFQRMASTFAQTTYKTEFPKTSAWFEKVNSSIEFKYIEAINNRTKHTADISKKLSMGILGSANQTEIGPFFRKEVQHDKRELSDQLIATIDFLNQIWTEFLSVFCDEFVLDKYVDNRFHKISGVYQQKIQGDPEQDLSYAYIVTENGFENMPNEIYVLFVDDRDEISAHISPFETILICKDEHTILGRYKSDSIFGEDCLLEYRKYIKDENVKGPACVFYEKQNKPKFYHWNPFFTVNVVSDDDDFINRSAMPF